MTHKPHATVRGGSLQSCAILFAVISASAAYAQPLTFHQALVQAWDRLPQRQTLAARQNSAAAQYEAGSAFFPNAPSTTGTYINDNALGSANNYITTQVEVSTPVWLPGEGTATQKAALAQRDALGAEATASRFALASQLLDLTAQATLAQNERDVAAQRLATTQRLAGDAANRFHTGEGAESDYLAADAQSASDRVALTEAESRLASARASLVAVLGIDAVPILTAPASAVQPIEQNPRIAAAQRAVQAAQANARLVRIGDRDDPEVGIQGINEKQPGTPWDTRVGFVVRFPFATQARNAPRLAAAAEQVAQAEVQLEQARRQVAAERRQADAVLTGAQQTVAAADRAAQDQERRRGMIERAWRVGEMPLIEVARADAMAFDARLAKAKGHTILQAARLRKTLAEGVLP